jgi:hypothetical protein
MSEPIKYGYRALGGTFLVIAVIIFGAIALALLAFGIILVGFSWLPYVSPEILQAIRILFLGARITDPSYAFLLFFISGLTLITVGLILFGFVFYLGKTAQIIDKDLVDSIESTIPSLKVLGGRRGRAILVLGIMFFTTILTYLAILMSFF